MSEEEIDRAAITKQIEENRKDFKNAQAEQLRQRALQTALLEEPEEDVPDDELPVFRAEVSGAGVVPF